jgi:large subunit ribosomal protein L10
MPTEEKVREVEQLVGVLGDAKSVILTDFIGLNVQEVSDLRAKCRVAGVRYKVVQNTLAKLAIQKIDGMQELESLLQGPNAWATHDSDQIVAAKVLSEFAKDNDKLEIRAGFMDGRMVSTDEIQALAKLPSREVLLSQTLSALQSPMAGFAGVCSALLRGVATVVDAYRQKRQEAEGAS